MALNFEVTFKDEIKNEKEGFSHNAVEIHYTFVGYNMTSFLKVERNSGPKSRSLPLIRGPGGFFFTGILRLFSTRDRMDVA